MSGSKKVMFVKQIDYARPIIKSADWCQAGTRSHMVMFLPAFKSGDFHVSLAREWVFVPNAKPSQGEMTFKSSSGATTEHYTMKSSSMYLNSPLLIAVNNGNLQMYNDANRTMPLGLNVCEGKRTDDRILKGRVADTIPGILDIGTLSIDIDSVYGNFLVFGNTKIIVTPLYEDNNFLVFTLVIAEQDTSQRILLKLKDVHGKVILKHNALNNEHVYLFALDNDTYQLYVNKNSINIPQVLHL